MFILIQRKPSNDTLRRSFVNIIEISGIGGTPRLIMQECFLQILPPPPLLKCTN